MKNMFVTSATINNGSRSTSPTGKLADCVVNSPKVTSCRRRVESHTCRQMRHDRPHSPPQTASESNQPFCHSTLARRTDRHAHRPTDGIGGRFNSIPPGCDTFLSMSLRQPHVFDAFSVETHETMSPSLSVQVVWSASWPRTRTTSSTRLLLCIQTTTGRDPVTVRGSRSPQNFGSKGPQQFGLSR